MIQNQTISVIYQDEFFAVDYSKLYNSSNKFREMIQPYLDNGTDLQKLQLRILYDEFSTRNVQNFLKILQNLKNDVHSNEISEVCKIAKLFQAEKLYEKSLAFVHKQIDPKFNVSNYFDESNGEKYLEIEYVQDLNQMRSYSTNNITFDQNIPMSPISTINMSKSQGNLATTKEEQAPSVIYKIQVLNPLMKCCRYFFSKEGKILFTAKKKSNEIYIGQGNDIHIHANETEIGNKCIGRIMQCDGYNMIITNEQEFKVTYVPFGLKKQFSLETSFLHEGRTLFWSPRELDINLNGEHNRTAVPSKKNLLLKNQHGSPTFIVRKMGNDIFEVECLPSVNSLIAFTLGLSQIVGPFSVL
ncbi:hypothetical protein M9Y10_019745 [Tritrichomonas musculus]|uniref:Tubby C-terminal domain-containing protein n=1 Tax=Tritrichomonas musculus TaxID=1915356 RepID=A0ABR2HH46_9EUKA